MADTAAPARVTIPGRPNTASDPHQTPGTPEFEAAQESIRYGRAYDEQVVRLARKLPAELLVDLDKFLVSERDLSPAIRDEHERRAKRDAYARLTGVDPEARRDAAVREHDEREAAMIAQRLASTPTLAEQYGVTCPAIALRDTKIQGVEIKRGDRVDLARFRWATRKLRAMFTESASARWFMGVPGQEEAIAVACAANEGISVDLPAAEVTPVGVEADASESAEDRARRLARERKQRQRAREQKVSA